MRQSAHSPVACPVHLTQALLFSLYAEPVTFAMWNVCLMQRHETCDRKEFCTFAMCLNKIKHMRYMQTFRWFLWVLASFTISLHAQSGTAAFREGEAFRKNKQYELALQKYEEAIRIEPTKYQYYVRKGDVLIQLKRPNEATDAYKKALELNPGAEIVYARLARLYSTQKNYPAAIDILNQAYNRIQDVNKRLKYKLLAIRYMNLQGQSSQALSELSSLKATIPQAANDPNVLYTEGETQLALGNTSAAIAAFQAAYDRTRDLPIAQSAKFTYGLALAHYRAGNTQQYDQYAKQIENTPYGRRLKAAVARSGAGYSLRLAQAYLKVGALDEAMEYVREAEKTKDRLNLVYRMQGTILYKKGRIAEAAQSLLQAAANENDDKARLKIYSLALKMQYTSSDYPGAIATADKILEKNPNDIPTLQYKAQALYLAGRYGEAISTLERLIPLLGTDAMKTSQAYFLMGLAARKSGNIEKAKDALGKVTFPTFKAAARVELDKLGAR